MKLEEMTVDERGRMIGALQWLGGALAKLGTCRCGNAECLGNMPFSRDGLRQAWLSTRAFVKAEHARAVAAVAKAKETAAAAAGDPLAVDVLQAIVRETERAESACRKAAEDATLDALEAAVTRTTDLLFPA